MGDDDVIRLIEEGPPERPSAPGEAWKVAIIDDDPAVHEGTRFALYDYELNGRRLDLMSAYSAAEGRTLLVEHPDIAVVMLDVVMESDDAGLKLVDDIRTRLKNETVRIILRTGQPGQAPERRVIVDYDINDYKSKTELTADKLFTALTAALRSHQQLQRMIETRRGLEIIIEATPRLFDLKSLQRLAEGVLVQICALLKVDCAGILVLRENGEAGDRFSVLSGSGCFSRFAGVSDETAIDPEVRELVVAAFKRRSHEFLPNRTILYLRTGSGREIVVLLEATRDLSDTDRALVEVFCSRLSVAFDNIILYEELQRANVHLEERVAERTRELTFANTRLSAQGERLRRANALKNEMLSTVAHDLKNPLGVILGRAEMLGELAATADDAERIAAQLGHIRTAAGHMTEMVDDLIKDAMSDALDITVRREPTDLNALVAEVIEANRPPAAKKGQSVTFAPDGVKLAMCDPERMREAIDNLVSNAIKYSPPGGAIGVAVEAAGGRVAVAVADNGPGLSAEDRARVFERFQRLSAQPTGGESSTGLGLSIVKRIVELHGGDIVAYSAGLGHGSRFVITVPVKGAA